MDERVKFVARLLDGEAMSSLCREFDISRKTGYKILERYRDCGVDGLTDRSRRPYRHANQLPIQVETLIVRLKKERPAWGAPKIRERLARLYPDVHRPAISTVHAVLDRHGLVKRRKGRRNRAKGTALSAASAPNALWCADYKGEFMLADRRYCYPLTITDFASRYVIACEALSTTKEAYAFTVFESAFREFGLPAAIRTDNGVPFASPQCPLQPLAAVGVVAAPRHRHRAHQAGQPAAERPSRAHAPNLEAGDHQAGRPQLPPAAGQVRRLHRLLQQGAAAPGARHALPERALQPLTASLCRPARARLSVPRQGGHRHHLRAHLLPAAEGQSQPGLRRANRRHQSRSRTISGSPPSCTTISATSTMRHAGSSRSPTPSARICYLCLRDKPSPMCPE